MASSVDICNLALARLGDEANISSIDPPEQSVQGQLCATMYPMARNALFDKHNWSFTMRRTLLAQLNPETLEYEYCYAAPSDMINMVALRNADQQRTSIYSTASAMPDEYSMEINSLGYQVIYCHFQNAELIYNANVTDPGKFPPQFVEALSWLLASYLAGPILKGDVGVAASQKMLQVFQWALSQAIQSDSQNRRSNRNFVPESILARQGFGMTQVGYGIRPTGALSSSTSGTSTPPSGDITAPTAIVLSAAPVSAHQVDLSWTSSTDNVGVAGYQVYRDGVYLTTVTATAVSDVGLTSNNSYSYVVKAIDAANNISPASNTAVATTWYDDLDPPTVPTDLAAVPVSSTQINLSWVASTDNVGVAGYRIFRNSILISTTNTVVFADTGLSPSTLYSYSVSAYDISVNISQPCNPVVALTNSAPDTSAPSTPTGLSATPLSSSWINLSWSASTDDVAVTGYKVYRNGVLVASAVTGTSYSDIGLNPETLYSYTVQAFDAAGNLSGQSAGANATTTASTDTTAPSVPTSLNATTVSYQRIDLTWVASTDAVGVAGYRIYRDGVEIGSSATNSYSDTGLTGSTLYTYKVAAFDAAGNLSAQSTSDSDTTSAAPDTSAPTVPTLVTATPVSTTQINLSWTASTDNVGVTGYKILRSGIQIATTASTTYNNTGLTPSTSYTYTVAAYDAVGNTSAQSTPISATTQTPVNHPVGIYSLDSTVNKPFVRGVLKRVGWSVLETSQGVYNFSQIDTIIQQAQALGQGVTLAIFAVSPPTYVKNGAAGTFNSGTYGTQPLPWDAYAKSRWLAFCQALAAHTVGGIALSNHPTLMQIDCPVIGTQGIRMLSPPPSYTSALYQQAVLDNVGAIADLFPNKNCYVGLFGIGGVTYPQGQTDARNIRDALSAKYDGVTRTKIGFYQETLTGKAPTTGTGSSGELLYEVRNTSDILFQECWSYTQKIANGTGTQCVWLTDAQGQFIDTPQKSIDNAAIFLSNYIEIYNDDLNNTSYQATFQAFEDALP